MAKETKRRIVKGKDFNGWGLWNSYSQSLVVSPYHGTPHLFSSYTKASLYSIAGEKPVRVLRTITIVDPVPAKRKGKPK